MGLGKGRGGQQKEEAVQKFSLQAFPTCRSSGFSCGMA